MKAIILAAGEGRRLHPITIEKPKALLDVGGRTLFERSLKAIYTAGLEPEDIIVLSGHQASTLFPYAHNCNFINNELYKTTNNIYSLWLARNELRGADFLLLNCDVLFHPNLLFNLLEDKRGNLLVVDDIHPLAEEEMKVMLDGNSRITAISKTLDPKESGGEYIGLAKFGKDFSRSLFAEIDKMISNGNTGVWYENAIAGILHDAPIFSLSTKGLPWIEIDTHEDLARADSTARGIDKEEN